MFEGYQFFTFGELLKGFRERHGMTQKEVAHELGKHRNTIVSWERNGLPSTCDEILLLETALHLSHDETDLLLYKANYPLEYDTSKRGRTVSTNAVIRPPQIPLQRPPRSTPPAKGQKDPPTKVGGSLPIY